MGLVVDRPAGLGLGPQIQLELDDPRNLIFGEWGLEHNPAYLGMSCISGMSGLLASDRGEKREIDALIATEREVVASYKSMGFASRLAETWTGPLQREYNQTTRAGIASKSPIACTECRKQVRILMFRRDRPLSHHPLFIEHFARQRTGSGFFTEYASGPRNYAQDVHRNTLGEYSLLDLDLIISSVDEMTTEQAITCLPLILSALLSDQSVREGDASVCLAYYWGTVYVRQVHKIARRWSRDQLTALSDLIGECLATEIARDQELSYLAPLLVIRRVLHLPGVKPPDEEFQRCALLVRRYGTD